MFSAAAHMAALGRPMLSFSLCIVLCSVFPLAQHATATDAISRGRPLSGNQTMVSKGGNFELGFFAPGNPQSHKYYIGIWYKKISVRTVIWVANRGVPVSLPSASELQISKDGNLVLLDHTKKPVWSSSSTSHTSNAREAILQDTGNLMLVDTHNSSAIAWQSFDHPTDTWLPGGWLGMNKVTGEYQSLTSWKSREDPAPGTFSIGIDHGGSTQYFARWNESQNYWTSGEWNGRIFTSVPEMTSNFIYNFSFVDNKERRHFTYILYDPSIITRTVMDLSGQLKQFIWLEDTQQWMLPWSQPKVQCDVYSLCGTFGVCDQNMPPCRCMEGFQPTSVVDWNLGDWSQGCKRKTNLVHCYKNGSFNVGDQDKFSVMANVRLPANPQRVEAGSAKDCELACLVNCTCTAFSYENGCKVWKGDLRNVQQLSDGDGVSHTLHLRLAASELPTPAGRKRKTMTASIVIGTAVGAAIVLLLIGVVMVTWMRRKRSTGDVKLAEVTLLAFRYSDLQRATKNFAERLGGGGFGSVFKGVLPDATAIAVKKLEGLAGFSHGVKQFRTELSTLGMVQHVNLVRLHGFCAEGPNKLLVYDYMPNGSLDAHLFRSDYSKNLSWKTRYQIIVGVARGLAYLHEKCRECIIHCDIKPENILLDADFCPKVADFGMAKLIGRDFSRVLTTMRGTIGYLAPEWISGLPITIKADVYSYGMMALEVISGKRNAEQTQLRNIGFYPVWAATKVNEGAAVELLDDKLEGEADMGELDKACRVACWCIQDAEVDRPSMGQVIQILEGVTEVSIPPIPAYLQLLMADQGSSVRFFSNRSLV